jgi:hypothetical protein
VLPATPRDSTKINQLPLTHPSWRNLRTFTGNDRNRGGEHIAQPSRSLTIQLRLCCSQLLGTLTKSKSTTIHSSQLEKPTKGSGKAPSLGMTGPGVLKTLLNPPKGSTFDCAWFNRDCAARSSSRLYQKLNLWMRLICRRSFKVGTEGGISELEMVSAMASDRKVRVELYSGWWISWDIAEGALPTEVAGVKRNSRVFSTVSQSQCSHFSLSLCTS